MNCCDRRETALIALEQSAQWAKTTYTWNFGLPTKSGSTANTETDIETFVTCRKTLTADFFAEYSKTQLIASRPSYLKPGRIE